MSFGHGLIGPRKEPKSGTASSLVVMPHGYGASGARWLAQTETWVVALPDTAFVAPNAPTPLPDSTDSCMWRPVPAPPGAAGLASVRASAEQLDAFIDAELDHYRLDADRMVIVGFSQGAMMAMHVALSAGATGESARTPAS